MGSPSDYGNDFRLTSRWETHVTTCQGSNAQVPHVPFLCHNEVKYLDLMLEFGQDISWVALVIKAMSSDLHLDGKLMSRPVKDPMLKYRMYLFSPVTKSNVEM